MNTAKKLNVAIAGLMVAGLAAFAGYASPAQASSHREAPNIIQDPTADNTDVYASGSIHFREGSRGRRERDEVEQQIGDKLWRYW